MWKPVPIKKSQVRRGKRYITAGLNPDGKLDLQKLTYVGPSWASLPMRIILAKRHERYRRVFRATRATERFLRELGESKDVLGGWLSLLDLKDTEKMRDNVRLGTAIWYDA